QTSDLAVIWECNRSMARVLWESNRKPRLQYRSMRRPAALVTLALLAALQASPVGAQSTPDALEAKLPSLSGAERAQALTALTDLLKNDQPRKAIAYGREALAWYATHPTPTDDVRTLNEIAWAYMI